ncbi:4-demethylwyosine synthase TYW1 [Methanohalophilus mahii]|uniref:S-adenosyl-L-methionine-dependent tRNA 4-demethylwyosine synthase n=1 Tax=Methanohalophilus mahii (strain ATCC 35705 / DSM 5219 / SLP) TaxID=547558 RepID=D5E8N3_METMS|nr:4-demethylwyosine synthase TYW1 [Methanohalophilus mahii]ADE35542.1 Wyosine base formation domain protein [Methanohalophilus mahii DSM 5219]
MASDLLPDIGTLIKKQGYRLAGSHSAVKTCLWMRRAVREEGECYKARFYGISSHRCLQMTPTLCCNQRCLHCWRPVELDVPTPQKWDSPVEIMGSSIECQRNLISGFGGSASRELWQQANEPAHVAISLSGEPTLYPYLDELIEEFRSRGVSTFVVTNGTVPETIKRIKPSQLYMSLDAPERQTYMEVCSPKDPCLWDNINESLSILKNKECRTAIRITLIKGVNMFDVKGYADLIRKAQPDIIEVKAYMHLGFSRNRLERDAMPGHEEVLDFANQLGCELGYEVGDQVEISRVVMLFRDGKFVASKLPV